jgi:outer membrane receptor protein involved in Fe transport
MHTIDRTALARHAALIVAASVALASPALAQTASPAAPPAKPAVAAPGVTVQAKRPDVQREIDRKSYNLGTDQQAATGSLADVLRNLPGVEVSPQGQVSIRGDSSVTILVDGQPSPLFQGPGAAALLQQLPASAFERIEVMTNPSAAFRPEGTGGVLNLISKKRLQSGREGSVSAKGISTGGFGVNARGVYVSQKLTLSGTAFANRNVVWADLASARVVTDPGSGQVAHVSAPTAQTGASNVWGLTGAASYQLKPGLRLLGDVTYVRNTTRTNLANSYASSALTGPLAQDYLAQEASSLSGPVDAASLSLVRTYAGQDHNLTLRAAYSDYRYPVDDIQTFTYQLPAQANLYQDILDDLTHRQVDLKAEYKAPLTLTTRLDIGYDGQLSEDDSDNVDRLGVSPASAVIVPALDDAFRFDQSVQAIFATYQMRLGKVTVLPGLRLEAVDYSIGDAGMPTLDRHYFEAYPTFHADYQLTQRIDLSASYSRRVNRPNGQEYDPFRVYASPVAFRQGNPDLAPEITDAFEAEAVWTKGAAYMSASLFYRDHQDLVSNVTQDLGGGALLTTFVNAGHDRVTGAELAVNAPLAHHITFNLSTDLFWNDLDVPTTAFERPSSGFQATLRPKINWDINPKDFLQVTLYATSRTLTLQGYAGPITYVAAGFRHKFNDRISLDLTTIDPFNTLRVKNVVTVPGLIEDNEIDLHQQQVAIGLTFALGPHPRQGPKDFDFSAGAAAAASGGGAAGGAPGAAGGAAPGP